MNSWTARMKKARMTNSQAISSDRDGQEIVEEGWSKPISSLDLVEQWPGRLEAGAGEMAGPEQVVGRHRRRRRR